jgi:hypothetical protein
MRNFPIGTAAVNWVDSAGHVHLRVYSSDGYAVTERCWDGSGWTNGAFKQPGENASATCWQDKAGLHIRVYCNFEDKTTEWCWDGGWTKGAYTTQ